jgi:hypothetical protein
VSSQELLGSCNNVSNDNGRAEREEDVLVVRMKNQSVDHLSCARELVKELEGRNEGRRVTYLKIR